MSEPQQKPMFLDARSSTRLKTLGRYIFIFSTFFGCIDCQTLRIEKSDVLRVGDPCQLICKSSDLSKSVIFYNDRSQRGTCLRVGNIKECRPVIPANVMYQNESTSETYLEIKSLDVDQDLGKWTCIHRDENEAPSRDLRIYDYEEETIEEHIPQYDVDLPYSTHLKGNIIQIRVCIFPIPEMKVTCSKRENACKNIQLKNLGKSECNGRRLQRIQLICTMHEECVLETVNVLLVVYNSTVYEKRVETTTKINDFTSSFPVTTNSTYMDSMKSKRRSAKEIANSASKAITTLTVTFMYLLHLSVF